MSIETDKEGLESTINKQAETIKKQSKEIREKQAELEKMRAIDIGKNKDIELLRSDITGYKREIEELKAIEYERVKAQDFKPASEITLTNQVLTIWTPVAKSADLFLALRKGIEAYSRNKGTSKDRIVFETDPEDKTKVVNAFYRKIESEADV